MENLNITELGHADTYHGDGKLGHVIMILTILCTCTHQCHTHPEHIDISNLSDQTGS